jgi:16S rRNA U1498 N3-methylase RsmE
MWVSTKDEIKAFDIREWASIMREAKARCKRTVLPKNKTQKKWQVKTGS